MTMKKALARKCFVAWIGLGVAACSSGSSSTSDASDSGSSDGSAPADGGGSRGASSGGEAGDALAANDGPAPGNGSSGSSGGPTGGSVRRTGNGKTDQGCVTHADCSPRYFCYLGAAPPTEVCGGPSGSCATCQGGMCPATFECSCLLGTLCSSTSPCTDDGKVIVCQMQPQAM